MLAAQSRIQQHINAVENFQEDGAMRQTGLSVDVGHLHIPRYQSTTIADPVEHRDPPIDTYPIIPPSDTLLIRQQKLLIYNNSNTVSPVYTFYTAVGGITSKGKKLKLFQEFYFTGH